MKTVDWKVDRSKWGKGPWGDYPERYTNYQYKRDAEYRTLRWVRAETERVALQLAALKS